MKKINITSINGVTVQTLHLQVHHSSTFYPPLPQASNLLWFPTQSQDPLCCHLDKIRFWLGFLSVKQFFPEILQILKLAPKNQQRFSMFFLGEDAPLGYLFRRVCHVIYVISKQVGGTAQRSASGSFNLSRSWRQVSALVGARGFALEVRFKIVHARCRLQRAKHSINYSTLQ